METTTTRADISQFANRSALLEPLETEYHRALELMLGADESGWKAQTPCAQWQVRDLAGHFLDVAFGYLGYFKLAQEAWPTEPPRGMRIYAEELGASALDYRHLTKHELVARLEALSEHLFGYFHGLDEQQWAGLMVPHKYAGPVPAFMMCTFQLMDYTVHTWDLGKALGKPADLNHDATDVLVPFLFGLKGLCYDDVEWSDLDCSVQVEIGGRPDDLWAVTVRDGAFSYQPGPGEDPQAVFRFADSAEFALDVYQRLQGGSADGDGEVVRAFRKAFFTI